MDVAQHLGVQIKRQDTDKAFAVCPLCHKEDDERKRKWKLQFYLESNSFSCHRCKRGGSVFDLVMEVTPCDFVTALEVLSRLAGREILEKEKNFYKDKRHVWQVPSVFRYVLNHLKEIKYGENQDFSATDLAAQYLAERGITNRRLIEDSEIVYVNVRAKYIKMLLSETNFMEEAITGSGIGIMPEMFWQDSILVPSLSGHKVRQFTSISCGMQQERRDPKQMYISNKSGLTPRRVWGIDNIYDSDSNAVYICESITDALSIMQAHYNDCIQVPAVALGGQHASEIQFRELTKFPKMKYFIIFDRSVGDEEQVASEMLADKLASNAYIVQLPLAKPKTKEDPKDINDLLQLPTDNEHIKEQFKGMTFAQMIVKATNQAIAATIEPTTNISIREIFQAKYTGRKVSCEAMPFSDIISIHSVPIQVRAICQGVAQCPPSKRSKCHVARCGRKGKLLDIETDDPQLLKFCYTKRPTDIPQYWLQQLAPPCNGKGIEFITEKTATIYQVELGPNIEYISDMEPTTQFTLVRSFIVDAENKPPPEMQPVRVSGRVVPHPFENNEIVFLANESEKLEHAIDLFEVTPDVISSIRKFQGLTLKEILDDLVNYTGIIQSDELHFAFLLTYHSALHYRFLGADYLGCLQTLILTDTSTGKSTLGKRLIDLFQLGERVVCETAGRTGITYTVVKQGKKWVVRWGAMPRNDRGFLMLDEFQEWPPNESQQIKEARSSGKLKVDKAAKGFTFTRNRIVIASNPKPRYRGASTQLFSFDYPITAIKTVFNTEADIRRLDVAVLLRGIDKTTKDLHQEIHIDEATARIKSSDWRNSVRWAWTRGIDDIVITESAVDTLLNQVSPQLVDKYKFAEDIPLFTASNTKHAVMRLSIAMAALMKSTDDTFQKVIVKDKHVEMIGKWLESIYSSKSVRMDAYANMRKKELYMTDEDFELLLEELTQGEFSKYIGNISTYIGMWVMEESWSTTMLKEATDVKYDLVRRFNRIFLAHRLLTKRGTQLNKTPKMSEFIYRFQAKLAKNPHWGVKLEDMTGPDIDIMRL